VRVFTSADLAKLCDPWVATADHLKGMKSVPQHPLPLQHATWRGEPVVAVVADSRATVEDGVARSRWSGSRCAQFDMETALDPGAVVIHPALGDNLVFTRTAEKGDVAATFAGAHKVVEATFATARHVGATLAPRSILADCNRAKGTLTVHHSTQAPHMMQGVFAKRPRVEEGQVRVICKDVGGSFGITVHVYPDEVAVAAMAKAMGRPVKFVADRFEAFVSDTHARDHRITDRIAVDAEGKILGVDIDDRAGIGPYSVYPRTSAIEGNQVVKLCGGPYDFGTYRCTTTVVLQNTTPTCQCRAVCHPIATAVTEGPVALAAETLGMDQIQIRRHNLIRDDAYPCTSPPRMRFEGLSHHAALDKLLEMVPVDRIRAEQAAERKKGVYRGLDFASFIDLTNSVFAHARNRRRAHLRPGRRDGADGSVRLCRRHVGRGGTGSGDGGDPGADRGAWRRRAGGARGGHHRRHGGRAGRADERDQRRATPARGSGGRGRPLRHRMRCRRDV
jgi:carbon-monoxide dehydrogenase large subunit